MPTTGTVTDFTIYNEELQEARFEKLLQVTGFNDAMLGSIKFLARAVKGDEQLEAFFNRIANLDTHRDNTSRGAQTALHFSQDERRAIKSNRKTPLIEWTLDEFKKIQMSPQELSFMLGEMVGNATTNSMFNNGLIMLVAAISGTALANYDATSESTPTMAIEHLNKGQALFGDNASQIKIWVMHSIPWHDLIGDQIADNIFDISGGVMMGGLPSTLGRPTFVTDSAALIDVNSGSATTRYKTLGLVDSAAIITDAEEHSELLHPVGGEENIVVQFQAEYAILQEILGYSWDRTNGGINPDETALAVSSNWDAYFDDVKASAGIMITTK